jgi:WD40 repeat protein
VASGGHDCTVRVWNLANDRQDTVFTGHHTGRITAVCPIQADGRTLLASTSHDGTARIWDPVSGSPEMTIAVHHEATSCIAIENRLIIGTTAGTLAVTLTADRPD